MKTLKIFLIALTPVLFTMSCSSDDNSISTGGIEENNQNQTQEELLEQEVARFVSLLTTSGVEGITEIPLTVFESLFKSELIPEEFQFVYDLLLGAGLDQFFENEESFIAGINELIFSGVSSALGSELEGLDFYAVADVLLDTEKTLAEELLIDEQGNNVFDELISSAIGTALEDEQFLKTLNEVIFGQENNLLLTLALPLLGIDSDVVSNTIASILTVQASEAMIQALIEAEKGIEPELINAFKEYETLIQENVSAQ